MFSVLFNMEPRLEWNKNVLAAKTILFHFRRDVWNEIMFATPVRMQQNV